MDTTAIYTVMFSMITGILLGGFFFALLFGALENFRLPAFPRFKKRKKKEPAKKREIIRRNSYLAQPGTSPQRERQISPEEARQVLSRQDRSNKYYVNKSKEEQKDGSDNAVS